MKRFMAFLTVAVLLSCLCPAYALSGVNERVVLGADLTEEQIVGIYSDFGVERGSMRELTVNNSEEREMLGGVASESAIGTLSLSCVYMKLLDEGSGSSVERHNIDWCTEAMYRSALETAGIRDVKIIVSAPFPVSGTCALVGIYKAYEDITGEELDEAAKALGAEELFLTGELAEELGSYDASTLVEGLKDVLSTTKGMSDEEIIAEIRRLADDYHVKLTDGQVLQLLELCRKLETLDEEALAEKVEEAKEAVGKLAELREKAEDLRSRLEAGREKISSFSEKLLEIGERTGEAIRTLREKTDEFLETWRGFFQKDGEA